VNTKQCQYSRTDPFTIKFYYKRTPNRDLGDPGAIPIVDPDPASGWTWRNSTPWSGSLPSTKIKPSWWGDPSDNNEITATRSLYTVWDCVCPRQISAVMVSPGGIVRTSHL